MKKKIRDITIAEFRRICKVHYCYDCPLFNNDDFKQYDACVLDIPDGHLDCALDKEVEIPDKLFRKTEQVEEK